MFIYKFLILSECEKNPFHSKWQESPQTQKHKANAPKIRQKSFF
jgi:hypothetical protein